LIGKLIIIKAARVRVVEEVSDSVVGQFDFHSIERRITADHAKKSQKPKLLKSGSRLRGKSSS